MYKIHEAESCQAKKLTSDENNNVRNELRRVDLRYPERVIKIRAVLVWMCPCLGTPARCVVYPGMRAVFSRFARRTSHTLLYSSKSNGTGARSIRALYAALERFCNLISTCEKLFNETLN